MQRQRYRLLAGVIGNISKAFKCVQIHQPQQDLGHGEFSAISQPRQTQRRGFQNCG